MTERIHIGVAWPYANGPLHLGHVAGAYLPADIFARYHRLKGNDVLMVSGSDEHGAPITIRAEKESTSPQEIVTKYHRQFLDCWQKLGISFDLFTTTDTENHAEVTQDIFLTLLNKGYLYRDKMLQAYCPQCHRSLPDRYIEGVCPYCGFPEARGDECEECGKPLNPAELKNARCYICGASPEFKESEHFFLRLSAFQERLEEWVKGKSHWRPNVLGVTWKFLDEGLRDRAITRDIDWGITVPYPGFENKRIYVWFEAVIGYLSATKEWARLRGDDTAWRPYWQGECKNYNFLGKDNIFFHTVIWPAILMGYGGLNLPYDVPANEFLNIAGGKLSTRRNRAIWLPDYLERYDPDPLRYVLSIGMPETKDSDFSWDVFVHRNNDELVATYGNLAHRVLTFTQHHFNGTVPASSELDEQSQGLLKKAEITMDSVDRALYNCSFREAIRYAMALAREANRYLDSQSPWKTIKEDTEAAANSVYTVLAVLSVLKTVLYPFLPFSSEKLHTLLGFEGSVKESGWKFQMPLPGKKLCQPQPLFVKLDESIIEQENNRLGGLSS